MIIRTIELIRDGVVRASISDALFEDQATHDVGEGAIDWRGVEQAITRRRRVALNTDMRITWAVQVEAAKPELAFLRRIGRREVEHGL